MKIESIRLRGIRCFEDTGEVPLAPGCNMFVGQNNAGKSTILKAVLGWQLQQFELADARHGAAVATNEVVLSDVQVNDSVRERPTQGERMRFAYALRGSHSEGPPIPSQNVNGQPLFKADWPNNPVVPFIAKRKAIQFDQGVNSSAQSTLTGTFQYLYARLERVVSPGTSAHERYRAAIEEIVGVYITTKASQHGKEGGYWFDDENFVTMERMGDGVSEMVALVIELSLAKNKIFVLEEPETNLHPRGLKALLTLVRESAKSNQFIIATHSNVVVRELGADDGSKVFRVFREGQEPSSSSKVTEVLRTPAAHLELMRELGYEFGDFDLHDAWLFLEEASAEEVIRDILIPWFVPELRGRLRTFSAAGASKLEPSVAEFQRLVSFVHLEPIYRDRIWVRADGDDTGSRAITEIRGKFPYLAAPKADVFSQPQFEHFFPSEFAERALAALAIVDKRARRAAKDVLRLDVMRWSKANEGEARAAWEASAGEQIDLLMQIRSAIS